MWKRSEVEGLTGLERHVIQNLCNKNASRDAIGFWEPAVMKPGYSRFDEGDLLAFYLVRQITRSGFSPSEVGRLVYELPGEGRALEEDLQRKKEDLEDRRRELDDQAEALGRLRRAALAAPDWRLRTVMELQLKASARHAAELARRDVELSGASCARVRFCLEVFSEQMVRGIWDDASAGLYAALRELLHESASLESEEALGGYRVAVENAGGVEEGVGVGGVARLHQALARALATYLSETENGVPIELAFGKQSFVCLGRLASAYASRLTSCNRQTS